jgi:dTDP-4-dehydrorhamnose reductase
MGRILLLGAAGYLGQAFAAALQERGWDYRACSRAETDYTRFDVLLRLLQSEPVEFVASAAGYTGKPNVDACETAMADTLAGNVLFPQTLAQACHTARVPWGHVSSGCVYAGAKVVNAAEVQVVKDLTQPQVQELLRSRSGLVQGFTEDDEPNFSFRQPPCSFYSGSKALGEEAVRDLGGGYLWRLRIPFDQVDHPKNYLTKLMSYPRLYENWNSISHRGDFARACLDLWAARAPFGVYNIVNPGYVSTRQVAGWIKDILQPDRSFEYWSGDEEFYRVAAKTPRSNCVLDGSKLAAAGVRMRGVEEALQASLRDWVPARSGRGVA